MFFELLKPLYHPNHGTGPTSYEHHSNWHFTQCNQAFKGLATPKHLCDSNSSISSISHIIGGWTRLDSFGGYMRLNEGHQEQSHDFELNGARDPLGEGEKFGLKFVLWEPCPCELHLVHKRATTFDGLYSNACNFWRNLNESKLQ